MPVWENSSSFKVMAGCVLGSEQFTGLELENTPPPPRMNKVKAIFHLTMSMHRQLATGKIQRNNYHHWIGVAGIHFIHG